VGHGAAEIDGAVQLEPVDAGANLDVDLAGPAVELALGLDLPALAKQGADDGLEVARGQLQLVGVVGGVAEAELPQQGLGGALRLLVAQKHAPLGALVDAAAGLVGGDQLAVVLEGQLAPQPRRAPVVGARRVDLQARPGRHLDLLELQFLGQVEPGQVRDAEQFLDQVLLACGRDG
jgi:hypothetical protein